MSWLTRFYNLKQNNDESQHDNLEPVFISGSRFIHNSLIKELVQKYPWADISNVSFSRLKSKYAIDDVKILNYMQNNRCDAKIYKHCNLDLLLIQTVHKYINDKIPITMCILDNIFNEFSHLICGFEFDILKTVFILDYRLSYFETNFDYISELLLYSSAALALINKQHLFPFIEFVIISDDTRISNIDSNEYIFFISHLQEKLKTIVQPSKILRTFDTEYIINLIITAHKAPDIIDLELF